MTFIPNKNTQYTSLFEDCVLYLDMKKDAKDLINQYDGSASNVTLTTDYLNIEDSAYSFNGSNSLISLSSFAATFDETQDYTFANWINTNTISTGCSFGIGDRPSGGSGYFYMGLDTATNKYKMSVNFATPENKVEATIVTNTWYHVVGTWKGSTGTMELFVNGISQGTAVESGGFLQPISAYVGQIPWGTPNILPWDGKITDIIVWERKLSTQEIKLLYDLQSKRYIYPYMKGGEK